MGHRRAPGVKHGGDADARAQMLGVRRDRHHRLGGGAEKQIVDDRLVLPGDVGDLGRQREDDMEIADRQQVGLALGQPGFRGGGLALRAVAVAAGVVGDPEVAAVIAAIDVAAQRRRPAALNRRHHLQLGEAQTPGLGETVAGTHGPEDIGDLQRGGPHERLSRRSPPGRGQISRACRAGWSRRAPSESPPWCRRRWCPAWRGRADMRHNAHLSMSLKLKGPLSRIWC